MDTSVLVGIIKIIALISIFFVWTIRYQNIVTEFNQYKYPSWLRDLVGILKMSFAVMLFSESSQIVSIGAIGIALLMGAALVTHFRVQNPVFKMLPSFCLMLIAAVIFFSSNISTAEISLK